MKVNSDHIVKLVNKKSWAGGSLPAFYDWSMKNSVIPKKFNASLEMHNMIIRNELADACGRMLELATGTGALANFINCNIDYSGVDISLNLLKRAAGRFKAEGFRSFRLYNCGAEELPFEDCSFDYCVCNLSLNFFSDIDKAVDETVRVMKSGASFFGSVPVPERNKKGNLIRGKLFSENELHKIFSSHGLEFKSLDVHNGALLYFRAEK